MTTEFDQSYSISNMTTVYSLQQFSITVVRYIF